MLSGKGIDGTQRKVRERHWTKRSATSIKKKGVGTRRGSGGLSDGKKQVTRKGGETAQALLQEKKKGTFFRVKGRA